MHGTQQGTRNAAQDEKAIDHHSLRHKIKAQPNALKIQ